MKPAAARSFVIVRQDNLGDVALALPMAGMLVRAVPGCTVRVAVRRYARDVAQASRWVHEVLVTQDANELERALRRVQPDAVILPLPDPDWARAAARARVPIRVGTGRRACNWLWMTHRPWVRRRGSALHEAQLNLQLLQPFGVDGAVPQADWAALAGLLPERSPPSDGRVGWPIKTGVSNVLVQLRSNGHGKEWPLAAGLALIESLDARDFNVIINGTPVEGAALRRDAPALFSLPQVTDATSGFSVADLMRVWPHLDAVLASSTGPLHLAALSGVPTLGLFVDLPGMNPQRWGPLGPCVHTLTAPRAACVRCPRGAAQCPCMAALSVDTVRQALADILARGRARSSARIA